MNIIMYQTQHIKRLIPPHTPKNQLNLSVGYWKYKDSFGIIPNMNEVNDLKRFNHINLQTQKEILFNLIIRELSLNKLINKPSNNNLFRCFSGLLGRKSNQENTSLDYMNVYFTNNNQNKIPKRFPNKHKAELIKLNYMEINHY